MAKHWPLLNKAEDLPLENFLDRTRNIKTMNESKST